MTTKRKPKRARGGSTAPGSVVAALEHGVDAARLALAARLASEIDDPTTPPYVRAALARVLADVLERIVPEEAPGVDVRALLAEAVGNGRGG
jgi:hypothetical protein